ncbi:amidase [Bauldia sp.]|uniref:amidase n=1 Tax=Bauldia sp. TaxID=2575872 RepID=UPI003BAB5FA3
MDDYGSYDALGLADLIKRGEVTALEVVDAAISAIEQINPGLNALIYETFDHARGQVAEGVPDGPFHGVPYAIKELGSMWQGQPQTSCCPYFRDVVAQKDSVLNQRLKEAGVILVGSTNAPEMGWALTTEPAMYGRTNNPWKEGISPGGSSGGAAAAVAARLLPVAEASDGAGSIRGPASQCGLVGLKPCRGRTTRAPFEADFFYGGAQFLCVSRTVRDTAAFLDVTAGSLPGDPYNTPPPARPWREEVGADPGRLRIGFTTTAPHDRAVHPELVEAVVATADLLAELGHQVEEHALAVDADEVWRVYTQVVAVQNAMVFDQAAQRIGRSVAADDVAPTVFATIERGRSLSGVQHSIDVERVRVFSREIASDLAAYDVYLTPTLTQPPRPFGFWDMSEPDYDAYNAKWTDGVYLFLFNVSGQPAMSLPLHWSADGLPIGVQLVGRPTDEATLIRVAAQLEAVRPWIDQRPPVSA